MKTVKLFFAIIAVTLTGTMALANTGLNKVLIRETSDHIVNLRTSLEADETMLVVISNEDGEIILKDEIRDTPGLVIKHYDFNNARIGDYTMEITINDEIIPATVIGKDGMSLQNLYSLEKY